LGITKVKFPFIALLAIVAMQAHSAPTLSAEDLAAIVKTAEEFRDAVVAENVNAIIALTSESGVWCTETVYPRGAVEADLRSTSGYLHRSLFDTAAFAAECGAAYPAEFPWISDRDFFLADDNATIEVSVLSENEAHVVFRSKLANHYPREYDFQKKHGSWRLVSGVIVCGCSCG
jgi:hypothetical protein